MKKFVSVFFAFLVCLVFCGVACADSDAPTEPSFTVTYSNIPAGMSLPEETLSFASTADTGNPDGGAGNIDFGTQTWSGNTVTVQIILPPYTETGIYTYEIHQGQGTIAGIAYDENPLVFRVLAGYSESAAGITALSTAPGVENSGAAKKTEFTNTYSNYGSLSVSNTVYGTEDDRNEEFEVTVTFSAPEGKYVPDGISYTVKPATGTALPGNVPTPTTGSQTKTVTINLKHGDKVTFSNVPAGVTYNISQGTQTGFSAPVINPNTGEITKGTSATASVKNTTTGNLGAGILLRSGGYILVLAGALVGLGLLLFRKKRS